MAQRFNRESCTNCSLGWAKKAKQPPCLAARRAAAATGRPQIRAFAEIEIGLGCPFTRPWPEVWAAVGGGRGYDANEYGKTTMDTVLASVKRPTVPERMRGREDVGAEAGYKLNATSGRYGYTGQYGFRPVLLYNPSDKNFVYFVNNTFLNNYIPDDRTTWVGFVMRAEHGVGAGKGKGIGSIHGGIMNVGKLADNEYNLHSITGFLERTSTVGGDATSGINLIIITGLSEAKNLKGVKFDGSDVNIALVANMKIVTNLAKLPKYASIARKIVAGDKTIENWEKMEMVGLAQRCGSFGTVAVSKGVQVHLIDLGLTSGAALSYAKWKGLIESVGK